MKDSNKLNSVILNWLHGLMKKHNLTYMYLINDPDMSSNIMEQLLVSTCSDYLRSKVLPELQNRIEQETDWNCLIRKRFTCFLVSDDQFNVAETAMEDFDRNIVSTYVPSKELKQTAKEKRVAVEKTLKRVEEQGKFVHGWIEPYMKDHGIAVIPDEKCTEDSSLNWIVSHMGSLMAAHLDPSLVQSVFQPYSHTQLIESHRLLVTKGLGCILTGVNAETMVADFETAIMAYAAADPAVVTRGIQNT